MKSIMPCLFLFLQCLHSGKEHIEGVIPAIQGLHGTAITATEQVAEKFLLLGKQTTHSQRKALCGAKLTQRQGSVLRLLHYPDALTQLCILSCLLQQLI